MAFKKLKEENAQKVKHVFYFELQKKSATGKSKYVLLSMMEMTQFLHRETPIDNRRNPDYRRIPVSPVRSHFCFTSKKIPPPPRPKPPH